MSITEPQVPRNKRAPGRFEVGTGAPLFPVTNEQVYQRVYFKALDLIAELQRAKRASEAPWVRKIGNPSSQENLVMTSAYE